MGDLREILDEFLRKRDWSDGELAREWRAAVGSGDITSYEVHLTKLMNGEDAGRRFVLQPEQLGGLAFVLDLPIATLRTACESVPEPTTLVLDPRLSDLARSFFVRRATRSQGRFVTRTPGLEAGPAGRAENAHRDSLRDVARAVKNPIVVLHEAGEHAFFEACRIPVSLVQESRGGYALATFPDWFPPLEADDRSPSPPTATERKTGRPGSSPQLNDARPPSSQRGLANPGSERPPVDDEEPKSSSTLPREWTSGPDRDAIKRELLGRGTASVASTEGVYRATHVARAVVWRGEDKLVVISPLTDKERRRIAGSGLPTMELTSFDPLVTSLAAFARGLNPYGTGGALPFKAELDAFAQEARIGLDLTLDEVRAAVRELHPAARFEPDRPATRLNKARDARVRTILEQLVARDWLVDADRLFDLDSARTAPLVHIASNEGLRAVANLGQGRLLDLWIVEYPSEEPKPVREMLVHRTERWLDAGDLRVRIGGNANAPSDPYRKDG